MASAKKFLTILILVTVLFSASSVFCDNSKVIVYYFHGAFRCPTCQKLEQYAKDAIDNNFSEELAKGNLIFKTVNVEEKENEHFVNDYQLYTKSLVLSLVKDGKEVKHKNLDKIWEYVKNKPKYTDYVKNEVSIFLKDMK